MVFVIVFVIVKRTRTDVAIVVLVLFFVNCAIRYGVSVEKAHEQRFFVYLKFCKLLILIYIYIYIYS